MRTRKHLKFKNRYWIRTAGGGHCDNCNVFLAGFLTPHVNKKTGKRLCPECYKKGEK